jgi:hypothetical protein
LLILLTLSLHLEPRVLQGLSPIITLFCVDNQQFSN